MGVERLECNETTHKRPRDLPFVEDYRPYTGRQLARALGEKGAPKDHWDLYYRNNTVNGYRDRHYIIREFHELREALQERKKESETTLEDFIWMEVGCGVGNAILPILEDYGDVAGWRLVGFDISSVAIELLQEKRQSLPDHQRMKFTVCALNPVEEEIIPASGSSCTSPLAITEGSVDFVSMIFVLCSISVEKHKLVLQRVSACMREGGILFFRDYCVDDHAEKRFSVHRKVEENTFTRSNGTLSHFFYLEEVRQLFLDSGFEQVCLSVVEREVVNRKQGVNMHRKFLQGRFRKAIKKN